MERYIIKANKIIAGDQLEVKENSGLLIENGKIQKIYDNISQVEIPEQINVIDYGDKVIIPGMIDCHNHLALDARLEITWSKWRTARQSRPYAPLKR